MPDGLSSQRAPAAGSPCVFPTEQNHPMSECITVYYAAHCPTNYFLFNYPHSNDPVNFFYLIQSVLRNFVFGIDYVKSVLVTVMVDKIHDVDLLLCQDGG